MTPGYQVMKFVLLDFDDGWSRTVLVNSFGVVQYRAAKAGGTLTVVSEGVSGVLNTYHFQVSAGGEVFVIDRMIHVPARFLEQERGKTVDLG